MTKVYDNATDLITFARLQSQNTTSGSSYLGSDGLLKFAAEDEPRIEYGSDGSLKGLLIEEQRTNLVPYSRPQAVYWSTIGTSVAENVGTAPDGTASASRITVGSATEFHFAAPVTVPSMGASPYTVSCFLKTDTVNTASLFLTQVGNNGAVFSLTGSGSVSSVSGTGNTAEISEAGNGWYRCSVTNDGGADLTDQLRIGVANGALDSYAGNGTDSILAWGLQIEQGPFATSYIPTSGSQSTRSPDIASIPVSAFGYNQTAGTVVVEASSVLATGQSYRLFNFGDETFNNRVDGLFLGTSNVFQTFAVIGGNNEVSYNVGFINSNEPTTVAVGFQENNYGTSFDGNPVTSDTSASVPVVTTLNLGGGTAGGPLNGHIKSIQYFPRRLTDAQLQELTS